ncbi:Proteasome lid subunit RPN8/RPN11, contains Jab1/MPN metalloenzyme (JAMM) motif [Pseudomonas flavescens]|uniref:Proteasome lid subunit RPN8/RPN11, contains Jab1/MPN metalloenzyme (JAMM) motif n=1 Tax=Phytopseudomonas flavescens TaxID=29435 RepID=A0A1G8EF40_9GAMM|nr:M67 family metallopeptidase [Pseudomonas flavescens]SDH68487.1 Proteasome lid subunit RPN8/RPN11, contains Jab1/MPN metalloenzyme (JAMM) motif [Pseudomonas flavescens]
MLSIRAGLLEAMLAQARRDHPLETCGIIAAPLGAKTAERLIAMDNASRSPTFFSFDPRQQLRVWRELDERDEECRVIYHSHTASVAYPSADDVRHAGDPNVHYVIVSTVPHSESPVRSFRIIDNKVTEESIHIVR